MSQLIADRVDGVSRNRVFGSQQSNPVGQFRGFSVVQTNATSSLSNAIEELSISIGSKLDKKMKNRKVAARGQSLIKSQQELIEIVKKMPKMNGGDIIKEIKEEIFNHNNLSKQKVMDSVNNRFKDPSYKYVALEFIKHDIEQLLLKAQSKGDQRLVNRLRTMLLYVNQATTDVLRGQDASSILAGINVAETAGQFEQSIGLEHESLLEFYRDAALDYKTLTTCYNNVLKKFGAESFFDGVEFLLASLGADIDAKGSSIDKNNLKTILNDIHYLRLLKDTYLNCISLSILFKLKAGHEISDISHNWLKKVLEVQKRRTVEGTFLEQFTDYFTLNDYDKKIDFYNRMASIVRSLPEKIFITDCARDQILEDLMEIIDDLVWQAEEEVPYD